MNDRKKWGIENKEWIHFPVMWVETVIAAIFSVVWIQDKCVCVCFIIMESLMVYTVLEITSIACDTFMLWVTIANVK